MGLIDTIRNIMTIPDEEDFDENTMDETIGTKNEEPMVKRETTPRLIKSKNQTSQNPQGSMQVVLVKPDRFDDVKTIADHLNSGKTVVLNLEIAKKEEARRIVDFLSGVAYANGGNVRKVAVSTFIIVANNIDVMGELMLDEFDEGKIYF